MGKMLLSPSISVFPSDWHILDAKAQPLEDRLTYLRKLKINTCKPHPMLDEIRTLRKQLGALDLEMHNILMSANPNYYNYWFK